MDYESKPVQNLYFYLNKYGPFNLYTNRCKEVEEALYRLRMMDKIILATPSVIRKNMYMNDWADCMKCPDVYFGAHRDLYIHFAVIQENMSFPVTSVAPATEAPVTVAPVTVAHATVAPATVTSVPPATAAPVTPATPCAATATVAAEPTKTVEIAPIKRMWLCCY
jgi:hypothetical protein